MTFVNRNGSRVVIKQIPFVLLFVTVFFTIPILGFSFFHIIRGTDAEGKWFCLVFGSVLLWLFLEFVATRERIEIDLSSKALIRNVSGVFKHRKTAVDLEHINAIVLELRRDWAGRKREYLCLYGPDKNYLINSPEKVYINHGKTGTLLNEITGIPYRGRVEVD
jgi:hypothetical protein